jgi:hypothetical protein
MLVVLGSAAAHGAGQRPNGASISLPGGLVGTWTRRITAAENIEFGIADPPDCVNVLTVASDGGVSLRGIACHFAAHATVVTGKITPLRAGVVRIDFGALPSPPIVAWKVSGRLLLLKALRAPDNGDRVLWTGTWHRK